MTNRIVTICLTSLSALLLVGCAARNPTPAATQSPGRSEMTPTRSAERVFPGDVVLIHAPPATEIDQTRHSVAPDGMLRLRLIGAIEAAGLTPEQIAATIQSRLSRYYKEPRVVVEVVERAGRNVLIVGEVRHPGRHRIGEDATILSTISAAGLMPTARRDAIRLVRRDEDERPQTWRFDLNEIVRSGGAGDIALLPGDVIEAPPSALAEFGRGCAMLFGGADNGESDTEPTP
ncbi:MAG: polysaccharide export protein [Phycisphaerales bacterium]|nr:polysaccharide export protein [Phycisphaerales bacterium]